MNTYQRSIYLERGHGCQVYDRDGNQYLDLIGGIATCSVGHAHPGIVETLARQSKKLINASNLYYTNAQLDLAAKLTGLANMDKCFFSNSGTEAVEAAIKLAKRSTGKNKIIAMRNGFHGRTLGSLSATWNADYRNKFEPLVPGFVHVGYNNIEALKNAIDTETAAVILEPIQGEAGVIMPGQGYLKEVASLCRQNQLLLILDEVQTGNGRTGKYFCFQHENVLPDMVVLAKGLANGVPIGVTLSRGTIDFAPGEHGSTFGGNSLACSVALETIEIIETVLPAVKTKGDYFLAQLNQIKAAGIKEIRGKGLIIAIELNKKRENLADRFAKEGLLVNCIQDKILRFLPPLVITRQEIDMAVEKTFKILTGDIND